MAHISAATASISGIPASGAPIAPLVERLVGRRRGRLPPEAGPPLGDDLEGVASWHGRPVVVTSERSGGVFVFVQRPVDDGAVWWPVPVLVDDQPGLLDDLPRRGCGVSMEGQRLVLTGGLVKNGDGDGDLPEKVSAARFALNLDDAIQPNVECPRWRRLPPLRETAAWPVTATLDDEAFVVGGIAGFSVRDSADPPKRLQRRTVVHGGRPGWRERPPVPAPVAGGSAVVDEVACYVGPGFSADGLVHRYDRRVGTWSSLPSLPARIGRCQLHLEGETLVATGGYDDDGRPQGAVYALDISPSAPLEGRWRSVGNNDALAGGARVVARDGRLVSLLVSPRGSILVPLE